MSTSDARTPPRRALWSMAALATALLAPGPARADATQDFYKGKAFKVIIRASPGGSYDSYSRLLGRHMVKYIPGTPNMVPVNMPGGGGLTALNYVANIAPRDGSILTMVTQSLPMNQALGETKGLKADLRKLNWIGNMSESNQILMTTSASPTRTLADAKARRTIIGATGIGSTSTQLMALYNNMLGTRFKIIHGYPSSPEINLAMKRGEVEGRSTSNPYAMVATDTKEPLKELMTSYNFIVQTGAKKLEGFENVPLLNDLATNDRTKRVFSFISQASSIARPLCTNEGVPAERVAALRAAFMKAMKDPRLLSEAKAANMEVEAMGGEELQKIVTGMIDSPADILDEVRKAMYVNPADAERAKGVKKQKRKKKKKAE